MRTLIQNGLIVDGSEAPPFQGDMLLEDERILDIGHFPEGMPCDRVLDADQAYVVPGFIDTHTQNDKMYRYAT